MLLAVEQYFFCKNSEPSPAGTAASDRTTDPSQEFGASATATPSARADAGGALTAKSDRPASMVDEVATVSRIAHAGFTARWGRPTCLDACGPIGRTVNQTQYTGDA